jgi:hypothetical protein
LFIVPVSVISPSSALSLVTIPPIGVRIVVLASSSRALSSAASAWMTCSWSDFS